MQAVELFLALVQQAANFRNVLTTADVRAMPSISSKAPLRPASSAAASIVALSPGLSNRANRSSGERLELLLQARVRAIPPAVNNPVFPVSTINAPSSRRNCRLLAEPHIERMACVPSVPLLTSHIWDGHCAGATA